MRKTFGFTIVEVLVATIILGVIIGVLMGPLGGMFRMTQLNQQLLDNTTIAQQVVEKIVADWQNPDNFSRSCLGVNSQLPYGALVTVQDLNVNGNPISAKYSLRSCSGLDDGVLLKRIEVTVSASGKMPAVIVFDVARRQP